MPRHAPLPSLLALLLALLPAPPGRAQAELPADLQGQASRLIETLRSRTDAPAEQSLHGLALAAARPGSEEGRLLLARLLAEALSGPEEPRFKRILVSQLQLLGREESVPALAALLSDPELCAPAARALAAQRTPAGDAALRAALGAASGHGAAALLQALSGSNDPAVGSALAARLDDPDLGALARELLARRGDPAVLPTLWEEARAGLPGAQARILRYAGSLARAGAPPAAGLCRELLAAPWAAEEPHFRCAALSALAEALGAAILPDLLAAQDEPDPVFREHALALAEALPGPEATRPWLARLSSTPPEVATSIAAMLGRRGDRLALPALLELLAREWMENRLKALKDRFWQEREPGTAGYTPFNFLSTRQIDKWRKECEALRLAALRAAKELGGAELLPALLTLLEKPSPEELHAAREILLELDLPGLFPALAGALDRLAPTARAAVLEVLASRGAAAQAEAVLAQARSAEPEVAVAALKALARLASPADLPRLVLLAAEGRSQAERSAAIRAAVSVAQRLSEPEARTAPFLAALPGAAGPGRAALLSGLGRLGGRPALEALAAACGATDPEERRGALKALAEWPDALALPVLSTHASAALDPEERNHALRVLLAVLERAKPPAAETLAWLERVFSSARRPEERRQVLGRLGSLPCAGALLLATRALADPALEGEARAAAGKLLASLETAEGPLPEEARDLLDALAGSPLAEEQVRRCQALRARVESTPPPLGFYPLCDGKSLAGWQGLVADPEARAKMSPQERAAAQAKADGLMAAHWRAAEGVLCFDGQGHNLCTVKDYADFELLLDWRIGPGGDSGLYLRGSPQVQIWDPAAAKVGSGGLYNNQIHPRLPLALADRPAGAWNRFRIRMLGERVRVQLNGVLVVDDTVMENYWNRALPIYPAGPIELQAHNSALWFRGLFLRELPPLAEPAGLSAEEEAQAGFVPLFNGRDLAGWTGATDGYAVEEGSLACLPGKGGNLFTEKSFADFVLRFEFRLSPGANNGLGIRAPLEGDAAYAGMELQILDDDGHQGLQPYQYHGSLYGLAPATRGRLKPAGEWNHQEVAARGRKVVVILNGATILQADLDEVGWAPLDGRPHPGLAREAGRIGLLGHGSRVWFRNLRLKELR